MKAYHKPLFNPSDFLNRNSTSHEHLLFPSGLYKSLVECLEESKRLLPVAARRFQEWDVGILERFDGRDVRVVGEEGAEVGVDSKKEDVGKGGLEGLVEKMVRVGV